ncbi:MAG: penicillin-binding protein 1C [Spirochaetes bacterium]|nr:penicillin-binding protein 1C [Spirochaetota bacterium]
MLTKTAAAGRKLLRGMTDPSRAPPFAGAALLFLVFWFSLPAPLFDSPYSVAMYDREGRLLGARVAVDGQWRFPQAGEPSGRFTRALVAFEDRRFYGHCGFDPWAIARAFASNLEAGRIVEGGSTLTMQTIRAARGGKPRTVGEKLVEAWLAVRLEFTSDKGAILALYAAHAPFGGNVVGAEAASRRYFGRPPENLTWAEAAELAVLPNAPSLAHPGRNRELLRTRRDALLESLAARGVMPSGELSLALAEPLPSEPFALPALAPQLLDRAVKDSSTSRSPRLVTTLDGSLQERCIAVMERHAKRILDSGVSNAACIVASVETGEVLAYVGNASGDGSGKWVDCAAAPRSSGSILKPFLYAAMVESGQITPRTLVADIPTRIGSFSPENMSKQYSGAVTAADALARSLNVPFVRLLRAYGVARFYRVLSDLGFTTLARKAEDYGLTLIIGGAEINLFDLAGAYASFARTTAAPRGAKAGSQTRRLRYVAGTPPSKSERDPFSRESIWLTLEALLEVKRPDEEASWQEYASSRKIAWKTGTSQGFRDAWTVGVSGKFVVAVWAGNATGEGRPAIRGAAVAAPIMFDLFGLLPAGAWFPTPADGLAFRTLCADSGYAAGDDCPSTVRVLLPSKSVPPAVCPYCRTLLVTADGKNRVSAEDPEAATARFEKRFVLPPALEWYYRKGRLDYRTPPPWKPGSAALSEESFAVVVPEDGSRIYVPVDVDGTEGMVVFSAVHRDRAATLFWHLDGEYLGETSGEHRIELRPGEGRHVLTVVDDGGRSVIRTFECLHER